jgi:hypothetical protein
VRYRVLMSVEIHANDYRQAHEQAKKLLVLLRGPLVKMAVESEGIRLSDDGHPIVHQPQREV